MSKVLFTEPAEYDLVSIEDYIRDILKNPTSAIRVVDDIIKESYLLKQFPKKHGYVRDKFLVGLGFRMTSSNNYNIFYAFDENNDVVHIIRVLYNRADWHNIL